MKVTGILIAFTFAVSMSSDGNSQTSENRDKALKGIEACLRRNEASSRECKRLNKNIETLENAYRQGDKTVLPTLLRFTYLTQFYGEALVSDPDGFLTHLSQLPEPNQQAVASGIAGRPFGLTRPRFDTIREMLMRVADSSPNFQLARRCLLALETENAAFLVNYFPPQTFAGRAGDFELHWFSRDLYALDEKPLWQTASENKRIYRVTVLVALSGQESVNLEVLPDGSGQIGFRSIDSRSRRLNVDKTRAISSQKVADFTESLNRIQFWQLPTEVSERGFDGADWILEGVEDGRYHVVLRWCPGRTPFGRAARRLFDLANRNSAGCC